MKLSVSLPDEDVSFVDEYAASAGLSSRSAVIRRAIALLRDASLEDSYLAAISDSEADDVRVWDGTNASR